MYILSPVKDPQNIPDIVNNKTTSIYTYFHLQEPPSVWQMGLIVRRP